MMRKVIVAVVLVGIFFYLSLALYAVRPFGVEMGAGYIGLDILRDALGHTHASNVVTSVVFGYRGYDTLGEATIFFVAVLGFYWTISRMKKGDEKDDHSGR